MAEPNTQPPNYNSESTNFDLENAKSKFGSANEALDFVSENDSMASIHSEELQKGLKTRHIQLIALGGAIGTGLFVGSGIGLYNCGPASLFLSYVVLSLVVWFVMNMLTEMATFMPVTGLGPQQMINDYLDPSFGFALGYNYWYCYAFLIAAEVVAAAYLVQYWTDKINIAVWITIFLVLLLILNMVPVWAYGESEFYISMIKVIAITGLIILGVVLFFGGGPSHDRLGFRYWKHDAFHEYLVEGHTGKFLSFWSAIIMAGFAFVTAPEVVVTCAGETPNPRRTLPRCANQFVYRLTFFYLLGSLVIGVIVDSRNPDLDSGSSDASASPFVLGIQNAGIPVLNHIINAVVLTAALSAGNSYLYAAARTLFSLSKKGLAPKCFAKTNSWGIPYYSVAVSFAVGCFAYLNVSTTSTQAFVWLSNLTTVSGFIAWIFVAYAYIRWRKAVAVQNLGDRVPYKSLFQPYGAYFVLILNTLISLTNGYAVFFDFDAPTFVAAYITLPIVFFLYVGHRVYSYFWLGRKRWLTPLAEVDFSKLDAIEYEQSQIIETPKNWIDKIF